MKTTLFTSLPAARFRFFLLLFFPFQWRGRIVSERSCSAQPASINLWLFSSIWLIVYTGGGSKRWEVWLLPRGRWRNPFAFPLRRRVHTKVNECSGIARKATVAALDANSIIFFGPQTLYSSSVWCERSSGPSPSALCFRSFSRQHEPSWNTKRSFSLTGDFLWGLRSLWMTDNRAVSIGAGWTKACNDSWRVQRRTPPAQASSC